MAQSFDEQGLEDAAILLMSLGEEEAGEVFRHLAPKEVHRLGETIARLRTVSNQRVESVLERFGSVTDAQSALVDDNELYIRNVMHRALGPEKADLLIDRILNAGNISGIESLKFMEPKAVADMLRNEHPQIVAAIFAHLETEVAAEVLRQFNDRQRNEVLVRMATLDGIQPSAMKDLNDTLMHVLATGERGKKGALGGVKAVAEIINMMGSAAETAVLDYVRELDVELAQRIADNMFIFDDLVKLDDKGIQTLMKEVQSESLVVALKGATPELRDKIFRNMSTRAAETLREDLEARGPVRLSEVEAEQKELLKIVRRLADEGQIMLAGGGDEQFV